MCAVSVEVRKRVLHLLKLELETIVTHFVGARS